MGALIKHITTFFNIWQTSAIFVSFNNFKALKKTHFQQLVVCQKLGQACKVSKLVPRDF